MGLSLFNNDITPDIKDRTVEAMSKNEGKEESAKLSHSGNGYTGWQKTVNICYYQHKIALQETGDP